jgi:hypothetical protein
MKKIITWLILSLLCTAAFAHPRPSQIEDALSSRHYEEARGMVAEVLREKPESARAHLLNAYLLAHVDHDRRAASTELQTAAGLDRRGDVKSSPLFGRVVAEIDAAPVARATITPAAPAPAAHQDAHGFPWLVAILVLSIGAAGLYMVIRRRASLAGAGRSAFASHPVYVAPRPQARPTPAPAPAPRTSSSSTAYSTPSAPAAQSTTVVHEHHYASPTPAAQPMGAFGTAASVAGGVVAGNALSDLLHHGHGSGSWYDDFDARRRERDDEDERRRRDSLSSSYSDPSPVSTSSERSSFSSSSSGSDSWSSSSSYDSGSSSDWGSSSSFDSGSSDSFD